MSMSKNNTILTPEDFGVIKNVANNLRWHTRDNAIDFDDILQEVKLAAYQNIKHRGNKRMFYTVIYRQANKELSSTNGLPFYLCKLLKDINYKEDDAICKLAIKMLKNSTTKQWLVKKAKRRFNKQGGDIMEILADMAYKEAQRVIMFMSGIFDGDKHENE